LALTAVNICNLSLGRIGATSITYITDTTPEGVACNLHYDPTRDALLRKATWRFASKWVELVRDEATDDGTSTNDTNTSLKLYDTDQAWVVNAYADYYLWITGGTGADQIRIIESNTATVLTVTEAFATTPDATSTYEIWENAPPYPWNYQYALPSDFIRFAKTYPEHELFEIDGAMLKSDEAAVRINYVFQETNPANFDELFVETLVADLAAKLCMVLLRDKVWTRDLQEEAERSLQRAKLVNTVEVKAEPTEQTWSDARRGWTPDGS